MPICAVIFDMDGLMLDTEPSYRIAWHHAAIECGHTISEELYFDLIGHTRVDGEKILLGAFGANFSLEAFRAACLKCEAAVFADRLPPKKRGLDEALALLDLHGVRKAIATSTERRQASPQLAGVDLLDRFDVLVTGDEVQNFKPSPDLFLLAAHRLGMDPSECLVLEDSEPGVIAAQRAGMRVFVVPDLKPPSPAVEALVDGKFESLIAVEKHLQQQSTRSAGFLTSSGSA